MRPISSEGINAPASPQSHGAAPHLQWLPIEQLVVDPLYQRDITRSGRAHIRAIAANFNWAYFAPLMVAPVEGGCFAVIDGQHRATAARLIGIEQVPCAVIVADRRTQAAAFEAVNAKTSKLQKTQIFHARLEAGDATALAVRSACDDAGVQIVRTASNWTYKPHYTAACEMIEKVVCKDREIAVLTLTLIRRASELGCYERSYLRGVMIEAMFEVLRDHAEWGRDPDRLWRAFETVDLDQLWTKAWVANAQIRGTTVCDQLQAQLLDEMDPALSSRKPAKPILEAAE
jgi:hypothetical protein